MPIQFNWHPKEDITTFELSQCLKILLAPPHIFPGDKLLEESYMRHFVITDPNN